MGTIIRDAEAYILVEFLESDKTINAANNVKVSKKLQHVLQDEHNGKKYHYAT